MSNCSPQDIKSLIIFFLGYSLFEFWLGKTRKFNKASTWEIILSGLFIILSILYEKFRRKNGEK